MTDTEILESIKNKLNSANNVAVICHIRPDGDTIGSSLALKNYIEKQKQCSVFCDDVLPQKFSILKGFADIKNDEIGEEYDLIVCLDSSDIKRIGKYGNKVKYFNNTINIDHHISNEKFAEINYVTEASSTCEIIFSLLEFLNAKPDKDTYACIFCGLSSDTGNFSHSNTTAKTFETASKISAVIGDVSFINQKIYKEITINKLRLLTEVLKNIKFYIDGKMAVLSVSIKDLQTYECESYETEGFVDYAINLIGVEIGAILMESEKNCYKISLRSKTANVCKIAAQFGGGGHIHASGCMLFGDFEEVVNKLVKNAEFFL